MARIGVISDIHGNDIALMAVLNALGREEIDDLYCLGDIVGYGPAPSRCLELALTYSDVLVRGNHDEAIFDEWAHRKFNPIAWAAIEWTRNQLNERDVDALVRMKAVEVTDRGITCAHDTPQTDATAYVLDASTAAEAIPAMPTSIGLIGHTHIPRIFIVPDDVLGEDFCPPEAIQVITPEPGVPVHLPPDHHCLCNPGAVGQPRDSDPRSSWGLLDTDARTFTVHRTEYDINETISRTRAAGLPAILGNRLLQGV